MTNKLRAVQEKYHTAKTMATIKNYFLKNSNEEVWKELEDNINKEYLVIPNKSAWYQDFVLGGGKTAQIAHLILEPFTHTINPEKFNAYGNVAFGDMLAMLRCCVDFNMDEIEVVDFGAAIAILAAMVTSVTAKKNKCKSRADDGYLYDVSRQVDWLVRSAIALFTSPTNVANTKFTLHIPNMHECINYSNTFLSTIRPYMKLLKIDLKINPSIYQGLAVGAYFMFNSGLNLRDNFEKPNLVFHEMEITNAQRALVEAESLKETDVISGIRLYKLEDAYELYKSKLTKEEQAHIEEVFASDSRDEATLYLPDQFSSYTHQMITTRSKLPEGMRIVRENPCEKTLLIGPVPIATCYIDVDKIKFENATKSKEWLINTISMLYSNAQDINRLRMSLQTDVEDKTAVVYVKVTDKDLAAELMAPLTKITTTLVNTYDCHLRFEITEEM